MCWREVSSHVDTESGAGRTLAAGVESYRSRPRMMMIVMMMMRIIMIMIGANNIPEPRTQK